MDAYEIFKIAGAMISSVGVAAGIIFALSSWLGKVWANRILEKDKLAYSSELESFKNKLRADAEKQQLIFSLYFEGQFKLYNDLWISLSDLQNGVDKLWTEANKENLNNFLSVLLAAKKKIKNSALLIDPYLYREITEAISSLENYYVGKEKLIKLIKGKPKFENLSTREVQEIINENRGNREKINTFVDCMLEEMRDKIRGKS